MKIGPGSLIRTQPRRCGTAVPSWPRDNCQPAHDGTLESIFNEVGIVLDRRRFRVGDMVHVLWDSGRIGWTAMQYVRSVQC